MTTRQKLYAMGEPLGECVTTRKVGGGYVCGGGGGSSASTNTTNTINTDKRITQQSGIALGVDQSTVYLTQNTYSTDAEVVNHALDTVTTANALQNDGFVRMLGLADKLFTTADSTLKSTQATTLAQVGALTTAQNDAKGAIDQKTILIMAAAGVAGLALINRK